MKTHRFILTSLAVAGLLTLGAALHAQTNSVASTNSLPPPPHRPPANMADLQTRRLSMLLKLTEEQKTQVKAALEKEQTEMQGLSPQERQAKRQAFQAELDGKMKEILTPEQFEHWEQLRGHRPPQQHAPLTPGTPPPAPATNTAAPPH